MYTFALLTDALAQHIHRRPQIAVAVPTRINRHRCLSIAAGRATPLRQLHAEVMLDSYGCFYLPTA